MELSLVLAHLGIDHKAAARYLGVSLRTLRRYDHTGIPRASQAALKRYHYTSPESADYRAYLSYWQGYYAASKRFAASTA